MFVPPKIWRPHAACRQDVHLLSEKTDSGVCPSERRSTLHTIADDEGTIYAEYIGIAERVRPDETTRRLLVVRVIPETGSDA